MHPQSGKSGLLDDSYGGLFASNFGEIDGARVHGKDRGLLGDDAGGLYGLGSYRGLGFEGSALDEKKAHKKVAKSASNERANKAKKQAAAAAKAAKSKEHSAALQKHSKDHAKKEANFGLNFEQDDYKRHSQKQVHETNTVTSSSTKFGKGASLLLKKGRDRGLAVKAKDRASESAAAAAKAAASKEHRRKSKNAKLAEKEKAAKQAASVKKLDRRDLEELH